jgi:hypothetical protein
MTSHGNITILLKGPSGPATLSDFASVCTSLRNSLRNVARCVAGTEDIEFDVSDLRQSSAFIEVAPTVNGVPFELAAEVSKVFANAVDALETGQSLDPRIDFRTLDALNGFSAIAKKRKAWLAIANTQLTSRFAANLNALLQADSSSLGSISGRLETVSIHNGNRFTLYPPVEGEEVDCVFQENELENILRAVRRNVTVYGMLHYSKRKSFPVRVDVESYEVMPELDSLPTLLNMRGVLKTTTRARSQPNIRDEWK